MKHTIVIRPLEGKSGGWLDLSCIVVDGRELTITKGMTVVDKGKLLPGDEPMLLHITNQKTFTFNYEDSDTTDGRNKHRKKMADIIPYHHQINMDGFKNPNLGTGAIFEMEDLAANHAKNVKTILMLNAAVNKVVEMTAKERNNVMYFYGENPTGMKPSEVFVRLVEPTFGVVLKRTQFGLTGKTYLEHFVNVYDSGDKTYAIRTMVVKALILKDNNGTPLLSKRGAAICYGETVVGNSVEEAIAYFATNVQLKDSLSMLVKQLDNIGIDDMEEILNGEVKEAEKEDDEKIIREKAKELRIPQFWNGKLDKIKSQIPHAEKVWAKVDILGLRQDVDILNKSILLPDIEKMVAKKEKELEAA